MTHQPGAHSVSSKQFLYSYSNAFGHTCALLLPSNFSFEAKQPCGETLQRTLRSTNPHRLSLKGRSHFVRNLLLALYRRVCMYMSACTSLTASDTKEHKRLLIWPVPLRRPKGRVLHSSLSADAWLFVSLAIKGVMMFVRMFNAAAQPSVPATHLQFNFIIH